MSIEKKETKSSESKKQIDDCFIIMPIADPEGYDKGHFNKVYEDIIKIACQNSGFNPVRADEVKQTNLIHLDILQKLIDSPMAICDLSNRNPNVLFELGLRQAFDKPTVLIQECGTPKIFDISPLRYTEYRKELKYREVIEDQILIEEAITATKEATDAGEGINSIISLLSLSSPASLKDISENDSAKMMQVIMSEINDLRTDFRRTLRRNDYKNLDENGRIYSNNNVINHSPIRRDMVELILEEIKNDIHILERMVARNSSIEITKTVYDNIQNNILKLKTFNPSVKTHQILSDYQSTSERLISKSTASDS